VGKEIREFGAIIGVTFECCTPYIVGVGIPLILIVQNLILIGISRGKCECRGALLVAAAVAVAFFDVHVLGNVVLYR
jgi:hypothetical protein